MAAPDHKQLMVILGIGKKPPRGADSAPPKYPSSEPEPAEPDEDEQGGPPDNDADDAANVTPEQWDEWLDYTGPDERCEGCSHMGGDGFCPIVKHNVDPQGNCHGFELKNQPEENENPEPVS